MWCYQYTVICKDTIYGVSNKRPDVILFVNGLPLVVIELKNPADENATIHSAFKQLRNLPLITNIMPSTER